MSAPVSRNATGEVVKPEIRTLSGARPGTDGEAA